MAVALIVAMLAQGALALGLVWYLGSIRIPMILRGEVSIRDIALSRQGWPEREKQVSNAVDNQFQLPLLFYVACGLALALGPTWFNLGLAWAFVVSRYLHAAIHITDNNVIRRFWAYTVGLGILTVFWLVLVLQLMAVASL
ncbi:MAPEG family protein [Devosia sp.]|uniref:MAPEG family protein n=1 Tax=Devosia sp. TaxID=1871048 RepID=UPI0037BF33DB